MPKQRYGTKPSGNHAVYVMSTRIYESQTDRVTYLGWVYISVNIMMERNCWMKISVSLTL